MYCLLFSTARYDPCREKSPWVHKIRGVLDEFEKIARLTNDRSKQERSRRLEEIIGYVRLAAAELDFTKNFESRITEVPRLGETNPLYPALSAAVEVATSGDRGRHLVASRWAVVGGERSRDPVLVSDWRRVVT